jgi:hypothetical protein
LLARTLKSDKTNPRSFTMHRLETDVPAPARLSLVHRDQRGVALVTVLLALIILTSLALTYLINTDVETRSVAATRDSKMALYAADAAIQEAILRLNAGPRARVTVNGSTFWTWIPSDLRTGGDPNTPAAWRFVRDDGINNGAGSTAPCGGSGLNDCSGLNDTADDWAEVFPGWRANIWAAPQSWVDDPGNNLPADEMHYGTLLDLSANPSLISFGLNANPNATGPEARSRGGIFIRRKLDENDNVIFTNGRQQFTAAQGTLAEASGGIGLSPLLAGGVAPAWPVLEIWATGRHNNASRRLVAEVANFPLAIPDTALYACATPNRAVDGNGAFLVSGYDYPMFNSTGGLIAPPLGNSTTGMVPRDPSQQATAPVPAVTVCCHEGPGNCTTPELETTALTSQIAGAEFFGANSGDGDTVQIGEMNVEALFESYIPYISATGCRPSCDSSSGFNEMGSETNFVIARISGSGTASMPNYSFGVLLLEVTGGQLKIAGNTRFYGLIIAIGNGEIVFQGTMGIVGALYVGAQAKMGGNPKLFYSRDALSRIRQLTFVRLLRFWEETI